MKGARKKLKIKRPGFKLDGSQDRRFKKTHLLYCKEKIEKSKLSAFILLPPA
jgi:hypothetical protein